MNGALCQPLATGSQLAIWTSGEEVASCPAQLRQPPDPALVEQVAAWIRDRTSS